MKIYARLYAMNFGIACKIYRTAGTLIIDYSKKVMIIDFCSAESVEMLNTV